MWRRKIYAYLLTYLLRSKPAIHSSLPAIFWHSWLAAQRYQICRFFTRFLKPCFGSFWLVICWCLPGFHFCLPLLRCQSLCWGCRLYEASLVIQSLCSQLCPCGIGEGGSGRGVSCCKRNQSLVPLLVVGHERHFESFSWMAWGRPHYSTSTCWGRTITTFFLWTR